MSTSSNDSIVIVSAARTPIGGMLGDFSNLAAHELGAVAIKAAVERAGITGDAINEVLMGNCLMAGQGQAPARQATLGAGLPQSVGAVTLSTVVSTMAAYALARCRSRIFTILESVFISGLMLPIHLAILPIFYLLDGFGLVDSRLGLMLVYAASGVPFSIFVLTVFFRQLPPELEEAAKIDGANSWVMFWRIMVPLVRPAVATVVVFRFVPIWNDFLFPLVLLRTRDKYTVPVGLTTFFGEYSTDWSSLFAGLVIATLPLIVLFLLATKQIVAGLTAGMSK